MMKFKITINAVIGLTSVAFYVIAGYFGHLDIFIAWILLMIYIEVLSKDK